MRKFLIYTSAGKSANVKFWASSEKRNYDIWVTNYSNITGLNKKYADYYNERSGSKIQNLYCIYQQEPEILKKYKAVMVTDDDLIFTPKTISALFNLVDEKNLWMLQPAFSRFGKISHDITRRKLGTSLRFVNFNEITCPIFRTDKLLDFLAVYTPEMPTIAGVDYWFPYFFGIYNNNKYAISDEFYCINPRDQFKIKQKRAIDEISSKQDREGMVASTYLTLGIKSFNYQEYCSIKRPLSKQLLALPLYITEIVFDYFWSKISCLKQFFFG